MKKIDIKTLRAIPTYGVIDEGKNLNGHNVKWVFIKFPNHQWCGFRGHTSLTQRELTDFGEIIPKDEIGNYINCTADVLDRYETIKREGVN